METVTVALVAGERGDEVARWLRGTRGVLLVGRACDADGLGLVPALGPDVVVLDAAAERVNPLVALRELAPSARCVVLGGRGGEAERRLMLELGAAAFAAGREELLRALGPATPAPAGAAPLARLAATH